METSLVNDRTLKPRKVVQDLPGEPCGMSRSSHKSALCTSKPGLSRIAEEDELSEVYQNLVSTRFNGSHEMKQ